MSDKKWQMYSFLSFVHECFNFLESFPRISVKIHALFWRSYCWDTHDVLIVPADAVIPDINGAFGVGLPACCYWLQHFCRVPVFAGVPSQLCPLLWLLLLLLFCYWISNRRIWETSGNWISDQSLKLSDYQILDSQKSSCPLLLKWTTNCILLLQSIQQYDTPTKGVPGTE